MATITIGSCTPALGPNAMTVIQAYKPIAVCQTYGGVSYFGWPATIVGKELTLEWPLMSKADFDALNALYAADAVVVFDPNDGSGLTYNVNITALTGRYYMRSAWRSEVRVTLLIMSQVP